MMRLFKRKRRPSDRIKHIDLISPVWRMVKKLPVKIPADPKFNNVILAGVFVIKQIMPQKHKYPGKKA